ncbi:hypothetical protein FO014_00975 [Serratia rhizosphaerae]|uniref:Uncharacterized protein n=1 Tax=Serratia rhizosphaerae TaxID=2597702 RepID=A0ABX6GHD7_9GAMM|nr:hypothetical protein [Serratia rhizosphaerae]QHA85665.1 hypothetical protein FO014_00975 [Serratia rhizosphaerae]
MTGTLLGFVLLVSPCGYDACDALLASETVYPTRSECVKVKDAIQRRLPDVVLFCSAAYRYENR